MSKSLIYHVKEGLFVPTMYLANGNMFTVSELWLQLRPLEGIEQSSNIATMAKDWQPGCVFVLGNSHGKFAASIILSNKSELTMKKDYSGPANVSHSRAKRTPAHLSQFLARRRRSASAHTRGAFMFQRRLKFEPRGDSTSP